MLERSGRAAPLLWTARAIQTNSRPPDLNAGGVSGWIARWFLPAALSVVAGTVRGTESISFVYSSFVVRRSVASSTLHTRLNRTRPQRQSAPLSLSSPPCRALHAERHAATRSHHPALSFRAPAVLAALRRRRSFQAVLRALIRSQRSTEQRWCSDTSLLSAFPAATEPTRARTQRARRQHSSVAVASVDCPC